MTVRLELAPEVQAGLLAQAQNSGTTLEAVAEQVLARHVQEIRKEPINGEHRPIWEVISDIVKDVPDEVFDRLPRDGASQVDHYIYGLPKRD
jgi:DNA-binding GntR family transcriptional regulator